ncbi:thioredoxin-disulfide reductase [Dethiobacter alkaliphilus]|uniref:Thioredoxin reductase n=1 Tax=Dethiobacter alkaliphilus AHT 1 TaxID=555088 RepID=C0GKZ0_DETAL|nr:thioredoxin-disulfide reductase [Dethiobacter alkaliphilus]EEG76002.1 thioredoxin reductase [Dethiobacter alkaliphilus AHT 1]
MTRQETLYDLIVLGGGPAGLTAAIYASRSRMSVLVIEHMLSGGQIATSDIVENYPGFPEGINGLEFGQLLEEQARKFGTEMALTTIERVSLQGDVKEVHTTEGAFRAKTLLIATGTRSRPLDVPGEKELKGKGVSYCVTCDGSFYHDKEVVVVGGGDSALEEALVMTKFASKVYLVHRREELRGIGILQDRVKANPKIELILNTVVTKINGTDGVESVTLHDKVQNKTWDLAVEGIFLYVGLLPNTEFLGDELPQSKHGYLLTNEDMETSVPGVYAAGDLREKSLRQVVTAVSDGAIAAVNAAHYLDELKEREANKSE